MKELSGKEQADLADMVAKAKLRVGEMSDEEKGADIMDDHHCLAGAIGQETD